MVFSSAGAGSTSTRSANGLIVIVQTFYISNLYSLFLRDVLTRCSEQRFDYKITKTVPKVFFVATKNKIFLQISKSMGRKTVKFAIVFVPLQP
jgi:hypothetical protein